MAQALISLGTFVYLYLRYIRYFITDSEAVALFALNPKQMIIDLPALAVIPAGAVAAIIFLILRLKRIPLTLYRLFYGGLGFCVVYFIMLLFTTYFPLKIRQNDSVLYTSRHLLVEIVTGRATIHREPSEQSPVLRRVNRGLLLLQADVQEKNGLVWNKVLIGRGKYGWILRISPARIGVPEKRLTLTKKFTFKMKEIYCLAAGLIGFIAAFFNFKLRPA